MQGGSTCCAGTAGLTAGRAVEIRARAGPTASGPPLGCCEESLEPVSQPIPVWMVDRALRQMNLAQMQLLQSLEDGSIALA